VNERAPNGHVSTLEFNREGEHVHDFEQRWATDMRAAQRGCAESYARLLGDIAQSFRHLAGGDLRRLGLQASDAEDVVQETLLAIHVKRHTWSADRPFLPWVRAIARHKALDMARRRGRRVEVPVDEIADTLPAPQAAPDYAQPLERFLKELPRGQRDVVEALAMKGASVHETAHKLNMSRGAVYVAFHRALATLALKFGDWGI
jgi:RNA polymerase sigma-70 factor (ECF subfamily)